MTAYQPKHADDDTPWPQTRRRVWLIAGSYLLLVVGVIALFALNRTTSEAAPTDPHGGWVMAHPDPEAKGVNEGKKDQAANVKLHAMPKTDPKKIAGKYGQYGGCTPDYGQAKQCLPPVSPAAVAMHMTAEEHPWDCGEVVKLFPKGIVVNKGTDDPLKLDYNHDGTACGAGD